MEELKLVRSERRRLAREDRKVHKRIIGGRMSKKEWRKVRSDDDD